MNPLYLAPQRFEELRDYLYACHVFFGKIDFEFTDNLMDEMEEYEHGFKTELLDSEANAAFDTSTDSGECQMIESTFGLIGGAVELEGYDANGVKIIWTIVPIPVGWYAPGVAP